LKIAEGSTSGSASLCDSQKGFVTVFCEIPSTLSYFNERKPHILLKQLSYLLNVFSISFFCYFRVLPLYAILKKVSLPSATNVFIKKEKESVNF